MSLTFWIIVGILGAGVLWGVYEFFFGDCDCEGCEYIRQEQEERAQKERDWNLR